MLKYKPPDSPSSLTSELMLGESECNECVSLSHMHKCMHAYTCIHFARQFDMFALASYVIQP